MVDMYTHTCWFILLSVVSFTEVTGAKNVCPVSWRRDPRHITFRNQCFLFARDSRTWISASVTCSRKGGNLVAIPDQNTQRFVVSSMRRFGLQKAWIGANDRRTEGKWVWTTGSAVTFSNWGSFSRRKRFIVSTFHDIGNKIQNTFNTVKNHARDTLYSIPNHLEDCAYVKMADSGRWHDAPCAFGAFRYPYICQSRNKPSTTHKPVTQKPHKRPIASRKTTVSRGKSLHTTHKPVTQKPHKRPIASRKTTVSRGKSLHTTHRPRPSTKRPHLPVHQVTPKTAKPHNSKTTVRPLRHKGKTTYRSTPKLPQKSRSRPTVKYSLSVRTTKTYEDFSRGITSSKNGGSISNISLKSSEKPKTNLTSASSHWLSFKTTKSPGFPLFTDATNRLKDGENDKSPSINEERYNPESQNGDVDSSVVNTENSNPLDVQTGDSDSSVISPEMANPSNNQDGNKNSSSVVVDAVNGPGRLLATTGSVSEKPSARNTTRTIGNSHKASDFKGDNTDSTKGLAIGLSVGAAVVLMLILTVAIILKRRRPKSDEEQVAMAFDNQVYGTPTVTSSSYDENSVYLTPCSAMNECCT